MDRAPIKRSIFADLNCPAVSAHPCGRGVLVKRLLGRGFVAILDEGHQFGFALGLLSDHRALPFFTRDWVASLLLIINRQKHTGR